MAPSLQFHLGFQSPDRRKNQDEWEFAGLFYQLLFSRCRDCARFKELILRPNSARPFSVTSGISISLSLETKVIKKTGFSRFSFFIFSSSVLNVVVT